VIVSVNFRIDFTTDYENILNALIKFLMFKDFAVLDENLNVLTLDFEVMKDVITNSPQRRKYRTLFNK
jgi:hypothetical protein